MTSVNLTGRLQRWALTLQEYEFVIEYRPGRTNVVADALSTAPAVVLMAIGEARDLTAESVDVQQHDQNLTSGGVVVTGDSQQDDTKQPRTVNRQDSEELSVSSAARIRNQGQQQNEVESPSLTVVTA